MSGLPPELRQFVAILHAQPEPIRTVFQYALCLLRVNALGFTGCFSKPTIWSK